MEIILLYKRCVCHRDYFLQYSKIHWKNPIAFSSGSHFEFTGRPSRMCHHCTTLLRNYTFVCVLVFIYADSRSAPRWMCLKWRGCGSRLRSEGPTPETRSPETCSESTTPFCSNTPVTHRLTGFINSTTKQQCYH